MPQPWEVTFVFVALGHKNAKKEKRVMDGCIFVACHSVRVGSKGRLGG